MRECSVFTTLYEEQKKYKKGSAGGSPKIELPNSSDRKSSPTSTTTKRDSMRAISKRAVSTSANQINVMAKISFNQKSSHSRKSLSATVNYNLDRERGVDEQERSIFSSKHSNLDRLTVKEEIEKNFGDKIAYHKIILSSGDNHINQRHFTRSVMDEWQNTIEKDFEYYAVEHRNTDHYHVHIIIPGQSLNNGDLRFDREDIATLRNIGDEYLARDRFIDRELDREVTSEFDRGPHNKLDKEVEKLFHMSKKDYEREQNDVGLETYREMRENQKELGLLFQYDPDRSSKNLDQMNDDQNLLNEVNRIDQDTEQNTAWDKELGDNLYTRSTEEKGPSQNREIEREEEQNSSRRRTNDDNE